MQAPRRLGYVGHLGQLVAVTLLAAACSSDGDGDTKDGGPAAHADDARTDDAADGALSTSDARTDDAASDGATMGSDASTSDAGGGGGKKVEIFVAQGHKGNLSISCDDGTTWQAIGTFDNSAQCFATSSAADNCDHAPGAARGLAYGNGRFVATFGWGEPGFIATSENGVDWDMTPQTTTFADVAFGNDVFVANDRTPQISSDGKTWMAGGMTVLAVNNVRAIGFVAKNGGRFVVSGESAPNHDVVISKDDAKSWVHPTTLPVECGASALGFASSPDVIVLAQGGGRICRSDDGGDTWTVMKPANGLSSPPLWTGTKFMVWGSDTLYESTDGASWTSKAVAPAGTHIGPVAVGKAGTFVAVKPDWGAWYDKQVFYRSTDGVTWQTLPSTAFTGSHPIYFMDAGEVSASSQCPGQ